MIFTQTKDPAVALHNVKLIEDWKATLAKSWLVRSLAVVTGVMSSVLSVYPTLFLDIWNLLPSEITVNVSPTVGATTPLVLLLIGVVFKVGPQLFEKADSGE